MRRGVGIVRRRPRKRDHKPTSICQVCEENRSRRGCPDAKDRKRKCERFTPIWDDEVT